MTLWHTGLCIHSDDLQVLEQMALIHDSISKMHALNSLRAISDHNPVLHVYEVASVSKDNSIPMPWTEQEPHMALSIQ
jgi:uncharacterized protein (DUF2249 family)